MAKNSAAQREYMRLREVFLKRAKRAEQAGVKEASIYLKGGYAYLPSLKEIKNLPYLRGESKAVFERDLMRRIEITSDLLASGTVSLKARQAKQRERDEAVVTALKESGYEHISRTHLKKFGKFMDAMRERYGKRLPNSDIMAEFFDDLTYNAKRKSLDFILKIWSDFEENGFETDPGNYDLFRS